MIIAITTGPARCTVILGFTMAAGVTAGSILIAIVIGIDIAGADRYTAIIAIAMAASITGGSIDIAVVPDAMWQ